MGFNELWETRLESDEADRIRAAFHNVGYDAAGSADYLRTLRREAYTVFPDRVLAAVERFKSASPEAVGTLVIDDLPIDKTVVGSPLFHESGRDFKGGVLTENLLVAFATLVGEPYSIAHEGRELVNNLTPHKEATRDYTGLGSEVELDFHIENAAQAYMPEGDASPFALLLLGVRGERRGGPFTRVADCRSAIRKLSREDIELLYGKHYIIRVPHRWRTSTPTPRDNTDLSPILSGPVDMPRVTVAFYPDMVLAVNAAAKKALDNLYQAIRAVSVGIDVRPGRLLVINNSFVLHSRDRFEAEYDSNGRAMRWVQRVFVARSLWNFRAFSKLRERVFDPRFALPLHTPRSADGIDPFI